MSHTRFDLGFTRHRKVYSLSHLGFRAWVSSIDHAREQTTRGKLGPQDLDLIPHMPPRGKKRDALVSELVANGNWIPDGDGWLIHDFLDWQDSPEVANARRERARERMREVRNGHRAEPERSREQTANVRDVFGGSSREVLDGPSDLPLSSALSSDLPDLPVSSGSPRARVACPGPKPSRKPSVTPLPEPFPVTAEHLAYAAEKHWPEWWLRNRHEQFCDLAVSKAWRYVEWNRAFYTYLRNEIGYQRGPRELAHLAPAGATVARVDPSAAQAAAQNLARIEGLAKAQQEREARERAARRAGAAK